MTPPPSGNHSGKYSEVLTCTIHCSPVPKMRITSAEATPPEAVVEYPSRPSSVTEEIAGAPPSPSHPTLPPSPLLLPAVIMVCCELHVVHVVFSDRAKDEMGGVGV